MILKCIFKVGSLTLNSTNKLVVVYFVPQEDATNSKTMTFKMMI